MNILEVFAVTLVAEGAKTLLHHQFGKTYDGVQGRSNLVTYFGEKIRFCRRGILGPVSGVLCGRDRLLELGQFRLQWTGLIPSLHLASNQSMRRFAVPNDID